MEPMNKVNEPLAHRLTGETCLMGGPAHEPSCLRCNRCHQWLRPEDVDMVCPGRGQFDGPVKDATE